MFSIRATLIGISFALAVSPLTAVTINQYNVTFAEDFDTLALTTSSVVPTGWELNETGSGANTTYGAGSGSSSTGNTYSFGGASSTDRALGTLRTSSVISTVGTIITNNTGDILTQLKIQYTGEQWRLGALGRTDQLDFSYSLNATSVATGTWLDIDALDFIAPTTAGTLGALDGNASDNRATISYTLTGLSVAPGASLWFRWTDFEASGSDDGLAIDDFAISAAPAAVAQNVPENLPLTIVALVLGSLLVIDGTFRRQRVA